MFWLICYVVQVNRISNLTFAFSNVERLRDFIKHVYVDRRYTGERSFDKPPRVKMVSTLSTHTKKKRIPQQTIRTEKTHR